MKKAFTLIAVLALSAPLMATDPNVLIACEDLEDGVFQFGYEVPSDDYSYSPPTTSCMATTNPDYVVWDSLGRPDCWCYERNCRGDVDDGMEFGLFWVLNNDLSVFRNAYGQIILPPGGICADLTRDADFVLFRVLDNDLAIFRTYYANAMTPPCSGPGSSSDEDPLPNLEYNFWTHP